jgi:hypothetical protein
MIRLLVLVVSGRLVPGELNHDHHGIDVAANRGPSCVPAVGLAPDLRYVRRAAGDVRRGRNLLR